MNTPRMIEIETRSAAGVLLYPPARISWAAFCAVNEPEVANEVQAVLALQPEWRVGGGAAPIVTIRRA